MHSGLFFSKRQTSEPLVGESTKETFPIMVWAWVRKTDNTHKHSLQQFDLSMAKARYFFSHLIKDYPCAKSSQSTSWISSPAVPAVSHPQPHSQNAVGSVHMCHLFFIETIVQPLKKNQELKKQKLCKQSNSALPFSPICLIYAEHDRALQHW